MIIVSDTAEAGPYPKSIGHLDVEIQGIGALSRRPAILVISVDLTDLDKVARLREVLRDKPEVVAISVDLRDHHARTQAYALGATALLPSPLKLSDLHRLVVREAEAMRADEGCRNSVISAAGALEESFSALSADSNLDMPQIRQSSADIVAAIDARGMAPWLDTVRVLHESTFQHCLVVTGVATAFGHANGMRREDVMLLTTTGLLHDIGKVRIPAEILDKPGSLTEAERRCVRQHPRIGHDYLVRRGALPGQTLSAVLHHHEYLDGTGYPDGLRGRQIDDLTRIMTVCDIYGALVESRPYKAPERPHNAIRTLFAMADDGKVEKALVSALARAVHVEMAA